ncbi:MAG: hypothetical protein CMP35_03305 [Rickettsiales bacterium]|nr:hypothetical protein [Rickettsiales bacterium]
MNRDISYNRNLIFFFIYIKGQSFLLKKIMIRIKKRINTILRKYLEELERKDLNLRTPQPHCGANEGQIALKPRFYNIIYLLFAW